MFQILTMLDSAPAICSSQIKKLPNVPFVYNCSEIKYLKNLIWSLNTPYYTKYDFHWQVVWQRETGPVKKPSVT